MTEIISVGYKFDISDIKETIFEILSSNGCELTDFEKQYFETTIYSGVYYSKKCRGGLSDSFSSDAVMYNWYRKKSTMTLDNINVKTLFLNKSGSCLVAEIHTANDNFYCFLLNKKHVGTTCQKKQLHQPQFYKTINLDEPLKLHPMVYIDER